MTALCPMCGQPEPGPKAGPGIVHWHGLRVESDPPSAYWEGKRIKLTRTQCRIMAALARTGSATFNALWSLAPESDGGSVAAHLTHIRQRLSAQDVPIRIENEHGWGYRLEVGEA